MGHKVKVPQEVINGIIKVRDSGKTNMFDWEAVKYWAFQNKDFATVNWLDQHKYDYVQVIFGGFDIEEESEDANDENRNIVV